MASVNRDAELAVHALGAQGDGLAVDAAGAKWIVPGALPGDTVRVSRAREERGMRHAEAMTVVSPSPERVASYCPIVRCGGCALREHGGSVGWKQAELARVLERADVAPDRIRPIAADGRLGYRHRTRLHRKKGRAGYFAAGSHSIVAFDACKVLHPELDARVQALLAALSASELAGEIEAVYSPDDQRFAIEVTLDAGGERKGSGERAAQQVLRSLVEARVVSGAIGIGKQSGARRHGEPFVQLRHPAAPSATAPHFFLEPGVFSQANLGMNAILVALVAELVPAGARVLELHAGAGNLTLSYAKRAAAVIASEWDEQAVLCLRRNVEAHAAPVKVVAAADKVALAAHAAEANVLVLDPPRTGAKVVSEMLANLRRRFDRIIYVSCDPATLGRDIRTLAPAYSVAQVTPVDMFFGTPHIEAVALLEPNA